MAIASRKPRQAVKTSSRSPGWSPSPTSGARHARSHRSSRMPATTSSSLAPASLGVSVARIPARAFTTSPRAQNRVPSPYATQRPRRATTSRLRATDCTNSATRRDLPIPGSPTIVTSRGPPSATARSNVSDSSARSAARPTNGVGSPSSSPGIAAAIRQTTTGSLLPLRRTGGTCSYAIDCRVILAVRSPTRIPPTGAAPWIRAAVFTTSPATNASPSSGRAWILTRASPVLMPIRTSARRRSRSRVPRAPLASGRPRGRPELPTLRRPHRPRTSRRRRQIVRSAASLRRSTRRDRGSRPQDPCARRRP